MPKPYRVQMFGKSGCDKCKVLNQRLDELLAQDEWVDYEKQYADIEGEDGLVAFAEAECINPQRIPALLMMRRNDAAGTYEPMPNPRPGEKDSVCGQSALHQYLGLQTDYSQQGRGVITPRMLAAVMNAARS